MRIEKMTAENIFSFKRVDVPWGKLKGIVVITGHNGSGKSALLEALYWGLTGKTIRRIPVGSLIRRGADEARVTLKLQTDDGQTVRITRTRTRTSSQLDISGLPAGGHKKEMQAMMEATLGLDPAHLLKTAIFSGDMSSFCSLSNTERSNVIQNMLGIRHLAAARLIAQDKVRPVIARLRAAEGALEAHRNTRKELLVDLAACREESEKFERNARREWFRLLSSVQEAAAYLDLALEELAEARIDYMRDVRRFEKKVRKARNRDKELRGIEEDKQAEIRTVTLRISELERDLDAVEQEIEEFDDDEQSPTCPTCRQVWPGKRKALNRPALVSRKETIETALAQARHKWTVINKDLNEARAEADELDLPEPPSPRRLKKAIAEYDSCESEFNHALLVFREKDYRQNPYRKMIASTEAKLKKALRHINAAKEAIKGTSQEALQYDYWSEAFSNQNLPAWVISSSIPILDAAVAQFAEILTEGRAQIRFDPMKERGKSSEFSVEVRYKDGADMFSAASRGERTCVDLCVLMAISELTSRRSALCRFEQRWMDEVFDGLDENHTERVVIMLRKTLTERAVFLVTHSDALKAVADTTITVAKTGGVSTIEIA